MAAVRLVTQLDGFWAAAPLRAYQAHPHKAPQSASGTTLVTVPQVGILE